MRRVTAPRSSITDEAFMRLEALACTMSQDVINLPTDEDDDDDFEPWFAPSSASKWRPSSASKLRSDRASMSKKSSAKKVQSSSGSASGSQRNAAASPSALKRTLNFADAKEAVVAAGDNSELSGTDDDAESMQPLAGIAKAADQPRRKVRPRLSLASVVTPSVQGSAKKRARSFSARTYSSMFSDDEKNDSDNCDDVPFSILLKKKHGGKAKTAFSKSATPQETRKADRASRRRRQEDAEENSVSMIDLTSPVRNSRIAQNQASPGIIEVRSSLYPLPVITQSPMTQKRCSEISEDSRSRAGRFVKRRRVRRIVDSDDDDDHHHHNTPAKSTSVAPVVYEPPPRPTPSQPSESVRKLVEENESAAGVEWYQERSIDDFSDSDSDGKKRVVRKAKHVPSPVPEVTERSVRRRIILSVNDSPQVAQKEKASKAGKPAFKTPPRANNRRMANVENSIEKFRQNLVIIDSDSDDLQERPKAGNKEKIEYVPSSGEEEIDLTGPNSAENDFCGRNDAEVNEGPPPFRLEILCEQGESVMQMMQRLGEDFVMEKIVEAQNDGRAIIGAEELGISSEPPPTGSSSAVKRLRDAVSATNKKKRANSYDPEKAFSGDYTFGYRGKGKEYPGRGKGKGKRKNSWRGRGRGRGRGRK